MTDKPLVSIVLPTYNGEQYLSNAIDSVINQTYKNWELIIVNDCSTDSTLNIIQDYIKIDSRIKVITNKTNKKLPASLNIGFAEATGKYYTWTSDDNEYYPEAIEKMVNFLERNLDFGMVYAQTNVEVDGVLQDYIWCYDATTPISLLKISVPGACFMYRETVAHEVGKYDETCFLNEDHDYWLRILLTTKIANLDEILYLYRLRKSSLTGTRQQEIKRGKLELLKKYRAIYSKKISYINKYYKDELLFDNWVLGYETFSNVKKEIASKKLYKMLKQEILENNKAIYFKYIYELGFIYIIKGLLLKFKQWKNFL